MNRSVSTLSRRSLLVGTVGVLAAPMLIRSAGVAAKSNSLTIARAFHILTEA